MNREETVKFVYDILKKHSVKVNEVDVIPVSSCIALVDDLINHEADLLKEFVEWLKNKRGFTMYDWNDGIMITFDELDKDLENFLKEGV